MFPSDKNSVRAIHATTQGVSTYGGSANTKLAANKVLRNTYALLAMTLVFSAVMAGVSMAINFPHLGLFTLVGFIGLFFLTAKLRNSPWGLVSVFALTGFMGLTLGPILSFYLTSIPNGGELIMLSMGSTGVIFLSLSGYVLSSRKDFSFMGGFLMVGMIIAILGMIGAWFFNIPAMSLGISAMVVLLMSGFILYDTSRIIHGGETNYIMATVGLYLTIYNLFLSLLHLLTAFGGDD